MSLMLRGGDRLAMRVLGAPPLDADEAPVPDTDAGRHGPDVEQTARAVARQQAEAAEAEIGALVTDAVRQWRLDDVIYWQRVLFRSRLIRASQGSAHASGRPDKGIA